MLLLLILIPLLAGGVALAMTSDRWRPLLPVPVAAIHLGLTLYVLAYGGAPQFYGWIVLDPLGKLVLLILSVLYAICAVYAVGYLRYRAELSNRVFVACMLCFIGVATLVVTAHHLGLMWIAIEATTLSTAPMIYFKRTARSIEATWKYLLVGSVGIAIALLGSFFLAYASLGPGHEPSLLFEDLLLRAPMMNPTWLQVSFVLLLVGYGTKMGLAPMHTWKPDAYGEAPGVVGALLAGGLTNCAFLALLRVHQICNAAGQSAYADRLLILMGIFSMMVAAVFMVGQRDFKRMLAYSSVEHMGILILGVGIGGPALYGALLHMFNNGLTKGVLFLSAANINLGYGSKSTDQVRGAMRRLPLSGTCFLLGFLAITGSPPFGPFVSEFTILNGAFDRGRFWIAGGFLLLLLIVFMGMGRTVLAVVQGRPLPGKLTVYRDGWLTGLPIVVSLLLVLLLGLHIPGALQNMLTDAVKYLEVRP